MMAVPAPPSATEMMSTPPLKRVHKMPYNAEEGEDFERSWLLLADIHIFLARGVWIVVNLVCLVLVMRAIASLARDLPTGLGRQGRFLAETGGLPDAAHSDGQPLPRHR